MLDDDLLELRVRLGELRRKLTEHKEHLGERQEEFVILRSRLAVTGNKIAHLSIGVARSTFTSREYERLTDIDRSYLLSRPSIDSGERLKICSDLLSELEELRLDILLIIGPRLA